MISRIPVVGGISPSFSVHKNGTNQTGVLNATYTLVTWSTEDWDSNSNFASNAFTPTVAGKYMLTAAVDVITDAGAANETAIYKNGVIYKTSKHTISGASFGSVVVTVIVDANGTTDYFEVYHRQATGGTTGIDGAATKTYFMGHKLP